MQGKSGELNGTKGHSYRRREDTKSQLMTCMIQTLMPLKNAERGLNFPSLFPSEYLLAQSTALLCSTWKSFFE